MSNVTTRFTWNIHWSCNYRCTYCFFDGHWAEYGRRNVYKTVDEWMVQWKRVHELYGRVYITINGGEPFAYPNFIEIIRRLSGLHWPINITTNTSLHLDDFAATIDPAKVSVSVSFHPQYHAIPEFLERLKRLRAKGFLGCNNFVAYPRDLHLLPEVVSSFAAAGESVKVIPFVGEYEGVRYPDGYTKQQKALLGMGEDWVDNKRPKGRVCVAGSRSALLLPDGQVTRCGQIGDRGIFANFFAPEFSLQKEPQPCGEEFCPCDEWKVIPDEKAPAVPGAWLP